MPPINQTTHVPNSRGLSRNDLEPVGHGIVERIAIPGSDPTTRDYSAFVRDRHSSTEPMLNVDRATAMILPA